METLTLGEKQFVRAKSAARELGYTSDYIGQLCRAGKIDAKLIGRSWYVDVNELKAHKKTRYGSKGTNKIKVKINSSVNDGGDDSEKVQIHKISPLASDTASHVKDHVYWNSSKYDADDQPLLPEITKDFVSKGGIRISVTPTDSEEIKVNADPGETYRMSATELPTVRLKGVLKVASIEDIYDDNDDEIEDNPKEQHKSAVPLRNSKGAIGMKRVLVAPTPVANSALNNSFPAKKIEVKTSDLSESTIVKSAPVAPSKPLSRFEQRVQEKIAVENASKANVEMVRNKPSVTTNTKVVETVPKKVEVEIVNLDTQDTPQEVAVDVRLAPYVTAAVALAAFSLVILFGLNSVISSNEITTKQTLDFNMAGITGGLFGKD